MPDQGPSVDELVPQQNPSVGARVSVNKKAALRLFRKSLNRQRTAAEGALSESELVRTALDQFLVGRWSELPEEARDLLDKELDADDGDVSPDLDAEDTGDDR